MPTMPERMSVVETTLGGIETDVSEIKSDVKLLVAWRNEERGARKQRADAFRILAISIPIVSVLINVVFRLVLP